MDYYSHFEAGPEDYTEADEYEFYEGLREVLAPEYADLSMDEIDQLLVANGFDPEGLENWFNKAAKSVGGFVRGAGPGMLKGALTGFMTGGPAGALIGAGTGAAAHLMKPGAAPGKTGPAAMGGGASGQLLQVLSNPQVLKSILAMALGKAGQQSLPIGGKSTPVAAISNLLGVLANRANAEYHAMTGNGSETAAGYLMGESGEYLCDPADAEQRADVLLELLQVEERWNEQVESYYEDDLVEFDDIDSEEELEALEWNEAFALGEDVEV